jgi:hypothetical protein
MLGSLVGNLFIHLIDGHYGRVWLVSLRHSCNGRGSHAAAKELQTKDAHKNH